MKLYTITLEATSTKTITLAADSVAEATEAAKDIFFELPQNPQLEIVEANPIAEAV